jgi:hypothetical protein
MQLAIPYSESLPDGIDYDELNINFSEFSSYDRLKEFALKFSDKKINVLFQEVEIDIKTLAEICDEVDNIVVRITPFTLPQLDDVRQECIPFLFDNSIPIYSYVLLEWALSQKPTSIYITDDLFYNLEYVKDQCYHADVELRMILNHLPSISPLTGACYTAPIYRPQDYQVLDKYIAIGEIDCYDEDGKYNWSKFVILHNKWFITHYWEQDLSIINSDVLFNFPTQSIPPEYAEYRSNCQHRCNMRITNACKKCERMLSIGYRNEKNNMRYKPDTVKTMPNDEELLEMSQKEIKK